MVLLILSLLLVGTHESPGYYYFHDGHRLKVLLLLALFLLVCCCGCGVVVILCCCCGVNAVDVAAAGCDARIPRRQFCLPQKYRGTACCCCPLKGIIEY